MFLMVAIEPLATLNFVIINNSGSIEFPHITRRSQCLEVHLQFSNYVFSREASDSSGPTLLNTWSPMREAVSSAPCSPGIFKIGLAHDSWIEVVYIGCSGSNRTLREVITSVSLCLLY